MTPRMLLATTNAGKIREIRELLADLPIEIVALDAFPGLAPPAETGATFAENAREKALYYAARTGLIAVAEDSGLEIDALGGAPGVESARYGGAATTYPEKFRLIYEALRREGRDTSPARFVCALALAEGDRVVFEATGVVEGTIAPEPAGSEGFGYDPIFFYPPFGRTLAQVPRDRKGEVSHRGAAFRQLRAHLIAPDAPDAPDAPNRT